MEAFNKHCISKRNIIFERARFNKRNQEPGESVELFIMAVHSLAKLYDFGALKKDLIRDWIVASIDDAKVSEHLQLDAELMLQKAVTKVRQHSSEKSSSQKENREHLAGMW